MKNDGIYCSFKWSRCNYCLTCMPQSTSLCDVKSISHPTTTVDSISVVSFDSGVSEVSSDWRNSGLEYFITNQYLTPNNSRQLLSHSSESSLFILYPFCNCIALHCLCVELYQSPLVCHAARCMFRPYKLWHLLPKFRSLFFYMGLRFQQMVLCSVCFIHSNKPSITFKEV